MSKKMLINALHAEEARVAIVEDGRLVDLDVEIAGNEQIRGNIYKGVVVRVEPGLQAAFVDVGLKKLGFLQMGEVHPENWKWRDDVPEDQRHRRPRIQEILRRGQELIVQVEKGERDNKGSALTTYISLPGRYMVVMPGSDSSGISRKVESESERKKLKEIIAEMTIPEGYGYIIRTEAVGRTREELQRDLDSLIALYEGVREKGHAMKGAGIIYQESALIIRTIRDYFSADIDEVLVDSKDVYKDVREALKEIDPAFEKLVKMHQEKRPIFSRYQLEEQIDLIYEKKVPLKSGGSIFIEPTEALVSIDVNSGKSTGEKGVEDTAFKTNLEAAEEAARQLRLRDLGGLIVIDFIDMRDRKHNAEVEKTLKHALKADKARVNVARISEFGLLEMSRQRIRQTLNQASTLECPHCDGRGKVKSVEAMALSFLRKVHAAAAKGTIGEVVGSLPLEVAYYLLNRKRRELSQIERDYDIEVTVKGKPSYLLNQMELDLMKREKLPEEAPEKGQVKPAPEQPAAAEAAAEGRKKKKKGKAKPQVEHEAVGAPLEIAEAVAEQVPEPLVQEGGAAEPLSAEPHPAGEGEHEEQKKKRRRKRKRGKGGAAEAGAAEPSLEPVVGVAAGGVEPVAGLELGGAFAGLTDESPAEGAAEEHAAEAAAEEGREEVKKKRRRKRRRGKGHEAPHEAAAERPEGEEAVAAEPAPAPAAEPVPAAAEPAPEGAAEPKKGRKRSRGRKGAAAPAHPETAAGEAPSAEAASAPAEAAAPEQAPAAAVEAAPLEAAAAVGAAPEKRKRPRGGRGKGAKAEPAAAFAEAAAVAAPESAAQAPTPQPEKPAETPKAPEAAPAAPPQAQAEAGPSEPAAVPEGGRKSAAPKAPKGRRTPKVAAASAAAQGETGAGEAIPAPPAEAAAPAPEGEAPAVKKPRSPRKKGAAPEGQPAQPAAQPAENRPAEVPPAEAKPVEAAAEPKPKKPRAPRKKKEEP